MKSFTRIHAPDSRVGILVPLLCFGMTMPASAAEFPAFPASTLPTLTNVAQVRALSRAEANRGYPAQLRGVVTYYDPRWDTLFIQDHTSGTYVFPSEQTRPRYQVGQLIEFVGKTAGSGTFSAVMQQRIVILGTAALPHPILAGYSQLVSGRIDSHWVEVEGVVHGMRSEPLRMEIDVEVDDGRIWAHVPRVAGQPLPDYLLHARVKVLGACSTIADDKDRLVGARVFVPDVSYFTVTVPGVTNRADLPLQTINAVKEPDSQFASSPRVRVAGTVTLRSPSGALFIQDQTGGLEIRLFNPYRVMEPQGGALPMVSPVELKVGDRVEAVGYQILRENQPALDEAEIHILGAGTLPDPAELTNEDLISGRRHGELVRVKARVVEALSRTGPELNVRRSLVQSGGTLIETWLEKADMPSAEPGSVLALTGIWSVTLDDSRAPKTFRLLLRTPADMVVVSAPIWWWTVPVQRVLSLAGIVVALGLGWVLSLRRQVTQRTTELQASEARYRTLVEHAPEAIVVLDAETGRFVEANENAERLFGLSRRELMNYGPRDLSPPTQADGQPSAVIAKQKILEALSGGTPRFEWVHRNFSGHDFPCEIRLVQLPDAKRKLVRGSIADITERKRAQEELLKALARERELGELKSNFVSMVSHEFRTPLEVILSSGEILQRYLDRLSPEQREEHLRAIHSSVHRMDRLMEEVLLLSKVEAGQMTFKPEPLDLAALCHRVAQEIMSATNHRVPIQLEIGELPLNARSDESLLRHILTNLLGNAVKYSQPGQSVRFAVSARNGQVIFCVEDHGMGIPAADHGQLFQAFHRARNVTHLSGSGLGLVIVKRCVDLHGGAIQFESQEGNGTTFTVTIPLFDLLS